MALLNSEEQLIQEEEPTHLNSILPDKLFSKVLCDLSLHREYLIMYSTCNYNPYLLLSSLYNSLENPEHREDIKYCIETFLLQWIKVNWPDFRKNLSNEEFSILLEKLKESFSPEVKDKINQKIEKKKETDNNRIILNIEIHPESDLSASLLSNYKNSEITKFLYIMECRLFSALEPSEFINNVFSKSAKQTLAPNVTRLINWFNHIVSFVSTTIYSQDNITDRVKVIIRWIEIAMIILPLGNYSSLMQIMTALNNALSFLKLTKKQLKSKDEAYSEPYEKIITLCSVTDLTNLQKTIEENSTCIPYLGIYLRKLVRLQETITDDPTKGGPFNFSLRQRVASIILFLQNFKNFKHLEACASLPQESFNEISHLFLHSTLLPESAILEINKSEKPPVLPRAPVPAKRPRKKSKVIPGNSSTPNIVIVPKIICSNDLSPNNSRPLSAKIKKPSPPSTNTPNSARWSVKSLEVGHSFPLLKIGRDRIRKEETKSE
jgi:hypothetical protein